MLSRLEYVLNPLQTNEQVVYKYWKRQNGKDTLLVKHGIFIKKVHHSKRWLKVKGRTQMAVVRFDFNRTETRVPYEELRRKKGQTND